MNVIEMANNCMKMDFENLTLFKTTHAWRCAPTEVSDSYRKRPEGRIRNDRQTLAWKNRHI